MLLDRLRLPIVLAPMAGGPSTPELTAAVSGAGGLGTLAAGYLDADTLAARLRHTGELTDAPIAVNLFCAQDAAAPPDVLAAYLERLGPWSRERGLPLGRPRHDDDALQAKLEVLNAARPAVVSFTFGCPDPETVAALQAGGSEVWVTVTTPQEGADAAAAGADVLIVQGAEAGGHRGAFRDDPARAPLGLLPLLQLLAAESDRPLVASGGLMTGTAVAAVLCAGARGAQLGSAFLACPEAGTSRVHREALLAGEQPTALTRAFSGRLARGIANPFLTTFSPDAPVAYPEIHHVTAPLRAAARERGDGDAVNLWAGEAYRLARAEPAATVLARLERELTAALERLGGLAPSPPDTAA
ncbi:MAG TPA: nitronate monooxygenase [Solirubrobacteraceae bacterium]|nr:nitronate monooxygenase [Solirubrobacteraceae bacterium]